MRFRVSTFDMNLSRFDSSAVHALQIICLRRRFTRPFTVCINVSRNESIVNKKPQTHTHTHVRMRKTAHSSRDMAGNNNKKCTQPNTCIQRVPIRKSNKHPSSCAQCFVGSFFLGFSQEACMRWTTIESRSGEKDIAPHPPARSMRTRIK